MDAEATGGHPYKLRQRAAPRASARLSNVPSVDEATDGTRTTRPWWLRLKRGDACVPCVVRKVGTNPALPRMVPLSQHKSSIHTHGMPRLHAHTQVRCKGGVPCLRCWNFALVCRPQEPLPASPGSALSEQPQATAAVPPPAAATDTPAADAHADNNPFLAAFLRQWNPALIAPAVVAAVATLLPAAEDASVGDGSVGEESAAAGSASLLDRGLVEAAM